MKKETLNVTKLISSRTLHIGVSEQNLKDERLQMM